ncbi:efflux RND transporter periplasmic adaptor subunit [Aestuariibacter sp. GS-14]|uniref:efflux RND transporter periplasmic adaptor subunit n=1 Tax=Aestuariibacter sp. GS-14 TaxID=2590670 RepID=UPI001127B22E|nr:efflux RND transporter periplasmic adaptor subunit [Aestuariibacter sp. GS-14]TPV52883.1 efflux RND transporter periplasmic adaptor subunit [Aestuariibacter sp. GS-14]
MTSTAKRVIGTAGALVVLVLVTISVFGQSGHAGPTGAPQGAANAGPVQAKPAVGENTPVQIGSGPQMQEASLPAIGVLEVDAQTYQAKVNGYGEVAAKHLLSLTAQVSGEVVRLSPHFETGALFRKGEIIAYLNDTAYQQAVASAKAAVETATVALEEERLQGIQARDNWQRSGLEGEPESPLVLREPYLQAAQASVDEAKAQLKTAERELALTQIVAPFDAVVITRDIQPGSFVQSGTSIAQLYSASEAEIAIPLSASQWQNLPSQVSLSTQSWPVVIEDMDGLNQWHGQVKRIEQHLDTSSRQRSLIVEVAQPLTGDTPLYFGTYVTAHIAGKTYDGLWEIPASAISQKQEVWYLDAQDTLSKFTPTVKFQADGKAYIEPLANVAKARIVARPLNSYLVGTRVSPQVVGVSS